LPGNNATFLNLNGIAKLFGCQVEKEFVQSIDLVEKHPKVRHLIQALQIEKIQSEYH